MTSWDHFLKNARPSTNIEDVRSSAGSSMPKYVPTRRQQEIWDTMHQAYGPYAGPQPPDPRNYQPKPLDPMRMDAITRALWGGNGS